MIDPLIIPLAALAIPIVVVPTSMAFKHAAKLRDLDHAERMRAMELGRINPGDETWTVASKLAAGIGAGVPIVTMLAATFATLEAGFHQDIWMASMVVGVAGVICGTVLAARSRYVRSDDQAFEKVGYDPDTLDVVGRRG